MIFVPSKGGSSHCPDEDTDAAHLVAGVNVLLHTALILTGRKKDDQARNEQDLDVRLVSKQ